MKKEEKNMTAHEQILAELGSKKLPVMFVVPQSVYDQFCAEMAKTGHANTVWGRPVQAGDVSGVVLVYDKPKRKKRWWWPF